MRPPNPSSAAAGAGLAIGVATLLIFVVALLANPDLIGSDTESTRRDRQAALKKPVHSPGFRLSYPVGTWDAQLPDTWRSDVPLPQGRLMHSEEGADILSVDFELSPVALDDLLDTLAGLGADELADSDQPWYADQVGLRVLTLDLDDGATATYGLSELTDEHPQPRLRILAPPDVG